MPPVTRGNPTGVLSLLLVACLLFGTGCVGSKGVGISTTPTAMAPVQTLTTAVRANKVPDLSAPPPRASPYPTPSVDPIVGTWYAPSPDDLTFEFFPDGTLIERSPNFQDFHGTWAISEEQEAGFYDATILDRWGYKKQVHILLATGTLSIKSMGTLHRVE